MLDRERILAKLDEIEGYLRELREVAAGRLEDLDRADLVCGVLQQERER